ncbi:endonuclease MutS2 [Oribacterium sp. oral taxon 108]|uniref:endonuclease MutS2 n=1 Tax=Oribacterium sp. oral taxon 108 TaxID=712414 RepID=UPI00020DD457|nr:endonuclease MutS2 [Oribacterium sp. oral taxon 108]EGL37923.1 MutS2 family protein [Oribacterium sp. oral taxon 108 str. F0425]
MNQKVLKTIEYTKIIAMLIEEAESSLGKERAEALLPSSDFYEVERNLLETEEAESRIRVKGPISFRGIMDIRPYFPRLQLGASLSVFELYQVARMLESSKKVKEQGGEIEDSLRAYFEEIDSLEEIRRELARSIESEERLFDDASKELSDIRRKEKGIEGKITEELNRILNDKRSMLQEGVITLRNGRHVFPVKAEYKNAFHGIVHDESSTGVTLFMEPLSIVQLENNLSELFSLEKEEVEKILLSLSLKLSPNLPVLERNLELLSHLDFVFAKAKLGKKMDGVRPGLEKEKKLKLLDARHPLIPKDKVVPISIHIGEAFRLLVITGPNTGGKTVCLKTLGLLQLMGQAGLLIPAFQGSSITVFKEIYADIGDEQSIEQSLSTFSAHMTNTVKILSEADSDCLCLFDELGAGTDPTEGAALALGILHELYERGVTTLATTHYAEIKLYALSTEGVENAACEFDVESLRPTYRLLIGVPGKSNAFAIAKKLGLSEKIIEDARGRIGEEDLHFEDLISDLEDSKRLAERERLEIEQYKEEVERLKARARESTKGIEKGREKILNRAREEAAKILSDAKETADSIVKEIRKRENGGGSSLEVEQIRSKLKKKMEETQAFSGQSVKGPMQTISLKNLKLGDKVRLLNMHNVVGTVTELPDKNGMFTVSAGMLRTKVSAKEVEFIQHKEKEAPVRNQGKTAGLGRSKAMGISPEINLIGKMTADALPELNKYLDDAFLAKLPQVRVVHGRGTGALRKMVHDCAKKNKHIESFRLGEYGEGSDGVTIIYFKK